MTRPASHFLDTPETAGLGRRLAGMVAGAGVYPGHGRVLRACGTRADGTGGSPGGAGPHDGPTISRARA
jgi:hypothetical protein